MSNMVMVPIYMEPELRNALRKFAGEGKASSEARKAIRKHIGLEGSDDQDIDFIVQLDSLEKRVQSLEEKLKKKD